MPTTVPLVSEGTDPTPLARAAIVDPCFWTPALPALYEVNVELTYPGRSPVTVHRLAGIRTLVVKNKSLLLAGQRVVLRGGVPPLCTPEEADISMSPEVRDTWRGQHLAMWFPEPADSICQWASQQGIWIVANLTSAGVVDLEGVTRRLLQWPAVAMVVLTSDQLNRLGRSRPPYGLLAVLVNDDRPDVGADQADVILLDVDRCTDSISFAIHCPLPVVAWRSSQSFRDPVAVRRACEELQGELAPDVDLAGYLVS
ncbi:MAG: hypothetical protein KDA60_05630 [Planctomycetales bacterium]|nr:hypothetical protein [Planctomycetales bacterium]